MAEHSTSAAGGKRDRTRSALIRAAGRVVDAKGFRAASLDEIAADAGMTKGAIYSNFGSKAELMLALARTRSLTLSPQYEPHGSLSEQLDAVASALIELLPRSEAQTRLNSDFQLYVLQEPLLREPVAEAYEIRFRSAATLLASTYGDTLRMTPDTLVMILQALTLGFAHQYVLTPERVTPEIVRGAFAALAMAAIDPSTHKRT